MTNKEKFYSRIEEEYHEFMDEVLDNFDSRDWWNDAEDIALTKKIYEYLKRDEPVTDDMLEHYLKLDKPLAFITQMYNESQQPIYDTLNPVLWRIAREELLDYNTNPDSEKLKTVMIEEYNTDSVKYGLESKQFQASALAEQIFDLNFCFDEYDAQILMQFKKPFKVLLDNTEEFTYDNFDIKFERAMYKIGGMDILTSKYALNKDSLLPETKYRHDMINKIVELVPEPEFETTASWLDFFRHMAFESQENPDYSQNPYEDFKEALETVAYNYSDEIIQQVYDLAKDGQLILENELVGAADYLSAGGDYEDISKMAECGSFDDFTVHGIEKGGMDLC